MHLYIVLFCNLQQILYVKECLIGVFHLFDNSVHALAFVFASDELDLGLNLDPHIAQVTRQIGVKGCEREQVEQSLQVWIVELKYLKRD